jgi:hypothetical protein
MIAARFRKLRTRRVNHNTHLGVQLLLHSRWERLSVHHIGVTPGRDYLPFAGSTNLFTAGNGSLSASLPFHWRSGEFWVGDPQRGE